jgi:protein SCO1
MASHGRISLTLIACVVVLGMFTVGVSRLTGGFELWTYEGLRRESAAQGQLTMRPTALRDASGKQWPAFTGAERGVFLVDFIYTRCPSVCQVLGAEFYRAQETLREAGGGGVHLLSISIDPARDDTAALREHAQLHHADAALWSVAAPVAIADGAAALRQLGVIAVPDGFGGFVHNGAIHLIDAQGRVHRVFDYADWQAAVQAAQQLAARQAP